MATPFVVGVQFGAYGWIQKKLEDSKQEHLVSENESLNAAEYFSIGAVVGLASSLINTPSEYVKIRMQVHGYGLTNPKRPLNCARNTYDKFGMVGLYKGFTYTALRDIILICKNLFSKFLSLPFRNI